MHRIGVALAAASLLTTGCGYVGGTMPPLANIPMPVTDLAVIQRGSRLIAQFTIPLKTTEAMVIKGPVTLDLRAGDASTSPEQWKHQPGGQVTKGIARFEIPAAEWTGKEATLAVRVAGPNGKHSDWSNRVSLPVIPPPATPAGLHAEATAKGVRLTWRAAGEHFRIFRKSAPADSFAVAGNVTQPEWLDTTTEFDQPYIYLVQTIADAGNKKEAESDLSEPVSITPKDTFPPAAPTGLLAAAAPNSVELSWDANTEPDLAGYRVYRSTAEGAFEKIAEVNEVPSYSDRGVEHGKNYRYAVSAIDKSGNEGERSRVTDVAMR